MKNFIPIVFGICAASIVGTLITMAIMSAKANIPPPPPDTRTVNEILDDRYKACVTQTGAKWVDQCKLLLNAKI